MRRNDLAQYDALATEWWRPGGAFAMLHWLAAARARLIPAARQPGEILVDLGCGGGVLSAYLTGKGYRHVGVDLVSSALVCAADHRVAPVRADVTRLPLRDGCAAVVSAGELLELVTDLRGTVAEACRILRPGGVLVLDTLNATLAARLIAVRLAERLGGPAVRGIHDPDLFVKPQVLMNECAEHGVTLRIRGVRPAARGLLRWLVTRRGDVAIVPSRSTAVLYQGRGVKHG
jgi:2-polyprenyl-6-hydroxyphenyl methylase / 3-demethylubiquinone-9 3-methyltransferase